MRVEHRRHAADRLTHQLQPRERKFAVRLRVIERDNLVLEQLIKTIRINGALEFNRSITNLSRDRPAVISVESFTPPAVEHAQINSAVRAPFPPMLPPPLSCLI